MTDYELAGRQWAEAQRKSRPIPSWFTTAEAQRGADAERELNIPAGAGARLPEVDNILEQQRLRRRLEMAPKLRAFMDDAINASLAKDDTENLTAIERGGKAFVDVNVKAASEFAKGALNIAGAAPRLSASAYARAGMLASMTEEEAIAALFPEADRQALLARGALPEIASREAEILRQHKAAKQSVELGIDPAKGVVSSLEAAGAIERTRRSLKGFEWADEFAQKHYAAAEKEPTLGRQARRLLEGFLEDPAGGFVFLQTVTLQSAPSLVAAGGTMLATGNPALASMVMGAGSASAEYTGEHTKFLNDNGIDIATEEGRLRLLSSPELLREADRRGLSKGLVVGMIDAISGGVASKKLLSGPVGNAIAQMFVQGFLGGAGEGLGDLAAGNDLNAASMAMEVLAEVSGVFVEVPMMAGRKAFTRDTVRAEKAGEARAVLEPLGEAATKSKLKERARDRFMAFLEKTDWQDVDIYVDASTLNTFFQEKDALPGDYGLDAETFSEAVLSGNDVAIPATLFADKIAGTEDAEFFLANGRFSSEAMSETEAARFNELIREETEKEGERIEAELRADLEARASDIQVRDAMYEQFRAAGRSPDAAEREASLWQAFFRTQGERYGEDPLELARMFGVRVEGPTNARSRIRDNFDIAINTLRARRAKPAKPKQAEGGGQAYTEQAKNDVRGEVDDLIETQVELGERGNIAGHNATRPEVQKAFREGSEAALTGLAEPPVSSVGIQPLFDAGFYYAKSRIDGFDKLAREQGQVPEPVWTPTPEDDLSPIMEELDRLGLTLDMTNDEIAEAMGIGEFAGEGTLFQMPVLPQASIDGQTADGDHPGRISTRYPSLASSTEDPVAENLVIDREAMKAKPDAFAHNVSLVRQYPNFPKGVRARNPDKVADIFIDEVVGNLLWLHDQVPAEIRERSKLWYDGARRITTRWAERYGVPDVGIAGVLAALSPQKDWYMNVSLAERMLDAWTYRQDYVFDARMEETAQKIFSKPQYAEMLNEIRGKTLAEAAAIDPSSAAMWIRIFDEAHNSRAFRVVSSEGEFIGEPRGNVAWGSLGEIAKGVDMLMNPTTENASLKMGGRHKVRNFFNNILAPNNPNGDVTIDTHAVAAGLLRPLSGNTVEVAHNFGNNLPAGKQPANWVATKPAAVSGAQGTYGLYAEAYRRAAAERGILPREMQSITWEAVRGLFPAKWKQKKNVAAVDDIWYNYRDGNLTLEEARGKILALAGGIENPSWFGPAGGNADATAETSYEGDLPRSGLSGGAARAVDGGTGRGTPGAAAGVGRQFFQQQTPEQFLTSDGEWRNQDVTVQDEDGNNVDVPAGLAADVLMERLEQARQILRCVNAG